MAATIQIIANLQNNAASPIKALREDIEGLGAGAEKSAGGFSKLQTAGAAATGVLVAGITASAVAIGGLLVDSVRMAAEMEAQVSNIAAVRVRLERRRSGSHASVRVVAGVGGCRNR